MTCPCHFGEAGKSGAPADTIASGAGAISLSHAYIKSPGDDHGISITIGEVFIMKPRTIAATFALAADLGV